MDNPKLKFVKNGAIWRRDERMWGSVAIDGKDVRFSVFSNTFKKSDNQPDFVLSWATDGLPACLMPENIKEQPVDNKESSDEEKVSLDEVPF